jgi:hypothetical protein
MTPSGINPTTFRVVAQCLSHCVTACPKIFMLLVYRDRNAGRGHDVKIDNRSIERVEEFKYLGATKQIKIPFRKKLKAD